MSRKRLPENRHYKNWQAQTPAPEKSVMSSATAMEDERAVVSDRLDKPVS